MNRVPSNCHAMFSPNLIVLPSVDLFCRCDRRTLGDICVNTLGRPATAIVGGLEELTRLDSTGVSAPPVFSASEMDGGLEWRGLRRNDLLYAQSAGGSRAGQVAPTPHPTLQPINMATRDPKKENL